MKCKKKSLQFDSFLPLSFSFCSYLIMFWKCHDPSSNICLYLQCTCVCICSPLLQITPSSKMQTVSDFYFEEEEEAYLGCKFLRVCVHLAEVKRQASFSVICPTAGPWILNSSLESPSRCLSVWRPEETLSSATSCHIHPFIQTTWVGGCFRKSHRLYRLRNISHSLTRWWGKCDKVLYVVARV